MTTPPFRRKLNYIPYVLWHMQGCPQEHLSLHNLYHYKPLVFYSGRSLGKSESLQVMLEYYQRRWKLCSNSSPNVYIFE